MIAMNSMKKKIIPAFLSIVMASSCALQYAEGENTGWLQALKNGMSSVVQLPGFSTYSKEQAGQDAQRIVTYISQVPQKVAAITVEDVAQVAHEATNHTPALAAGAALGGLYQAGAFGAAARKISQGVRDAGRWCFVHHKRLAGQLGMLICGSAYLAKDAIARAVTAGLQSAQPMMEKLAESSTQQEIGIGVAAAIGTAATLKGMNWIIQKLQRPKLVYVLKQEPVVVAQAGEAPMKATPVSPLDALRKYNNAQCLHDESGELSQFVHDISMSILTAFVTADLHASGKLEPAEYKPCAFFACVKPYEGMQSHQRQEFKQLQQDFEAAYKTFWHASSNEQREQYQEEFDQIAQRINTFLQGL
jgi:hypothetical protein